METTNQDEIIPTSLEVDEERGVSILDDANAGPQGATISAVTFGSAPIGSTSTQITATRRINRQDVKAIFRASTTKAAASHEQIDRIKRMHKKISDGVNWDFNYSCLLMVASVVASLGLATDSSTTVISSMLLSPIMGPVIGMSYGLIIWDLPLIKRSARNEVLSILVCIIFGLIIGACCVWTQMAEDWPTNEMLSRGTRTTFLAGFPIAFFSGLGVALSVLDDQTSSLVGVAISASLLPPAVNCGMLFIVAAVKGGDWSNFDFKFEVVKDLLEKYDVPNFSEMGLTSLMLTVANVALVAIGATLMFRLKEVLPVNKKVFWDDLKVARRIYQGRALDSVTGDVLSLEQCSNQAQLPSLDDLESPTMSTD
ncbi:hypothetical protein ACHAXR_003014 [Thalassiosira sp. AJA248-18]